MYVQCIYFMNNPHHVVLETQKKYLKWSQNILEIPSNYQLILCSIESMAISTYKHRLQKSNLYCNGFIIKKLIYWSGPTHNHPGWHPKQAVDLSQRTQAAVQIVSNLPDLPFFGHAGHADPLDGWRCCSQKRVMSRPIQVRQL